MINSHQSQTHLRTPVMMRGSRAVMLGTDGWTVQLSIVSVYSPTESTPPDSESCDAGWS